MTHAAFVHAAYKKRWNEMHLLFLLSNHQVTDPGDFNNKVTNHQVTDPGDLVVEVTDPGDFDWFLLFIPIMKPLNK